LSESWPCNLAGVWYARGLIQLLHEDDPEGAARSLAAANWFGAALRDRLHAIGTDDAETALICREAEIAWLHALARFDPAQAVAAFAHVCGNAEGPEELLAHRQRRFYRLFADLVNLGHYGFAEQILDSGPEPADWLNTAAGSPGFAWGMYLLNHRSDFPGAAAAFARVWKEAHRAPADSALFWAARFHEGLANRYQGNVAAANAIAAEIRNPGLNTPPVPEDLRARVAELTAARR
jgi:hypothetical protein